MSHRLPVRLPLFGAALGGALLFAFLTLAIDHGAMFHVDVRLIRAVYVQLPAWLDAAHGPIHSGHRAEQLRRLVQHLMDVGSVDVSAGLALLLALWLARRSRRPALALLPAFFAIVLVELILKSGLHHPGPTQESAAVAANSYPSGHMARTTFIAVCVVMIKPNPIVLVGALALTLAMAFSLIYLPVHWPSDVLGGGLLGCSAALSVWSIARLRRFTPSGCDKRSGG